MSNHPTDAKDLPVKFRQANGVANIDILQEEYFFLSAKIIDHHLSFFL
jgi:hypothetical protein